MPSQTRMRRTLRTRGAGEPHASTAPASKPGRPSAAGAAPVRTSNGRSGSAARVRQLVLAMASVRLTGWCRRATPRQSGRRRTTAADVRVQTSSGRSGCAFWERLEPHHLHYRRGWAARRLARRRGPCRQSSSPWWAAGAAVSRFGRERGSAGPLSFTRSQKRLVLARRPRYCPVPSPF